MIKDKKITLFLGIILLIIVVIYIYFFITLKKELIVKQIDAEDSSYVIENLNEDTEFKINTNDMTYFITDINGKKLSTENKFENHVLIIKPKERYQDGIIYKLELKNGDSFVDEKLQDARCVYFGLSSEKLGQDKFDYEISKINLKKEYTLKNKRLNLDNMEIELRMKLLNKKVVVNPKNYKIFIDGKEQSKILKPTKGKHVIRIQFQYNKKNYEYSQQVNIKEIPIEQTARFIYKKALGNNIMIVDINKDGIPEAIDFDYYDKDEYTTRTKVKIYSIENEKMYCVCFHTVEYLQSMKLLKNNQLYLNCHIASDTSTIYILKFQFINNKLKLLKCLDGVKSEDHTLDSSNPYYSIYCIGDNEYTEKEFLKKYPVEKVLYN